MTFCRGEYYKSLVHEFLQRRINEFEPGVLGEQSKSNLLLFYRDLNEWFPIRSVARKILGPRELFARNLYMGIVFAILHVLQIA